MSEQVHHIDLPTTSMFVNGSVVATTPRKSEEGGPTPVLDAQKQWGHIAPWGTDNRHPQNVVDDKRRVALMASVIERKVQMLIGGGLRYGKVAVDPRTGQEHMVPMRVPAIEQFFRDSNIRLFLREAANDWYSFANVFVEIHLGRARDRITHIGCQDATHVRLGRMDDRGEINTAYMADWRYNGPAFHLPALDPYRNVAKQLQRHKHPRSILPIRHLNDGQFYYGVTPWNALRINGWVDIIKRVPQLKLLLLGGLMNIRYHLEFDIQYWPSKFKDWSAKTEPERIGLMQAEVRQLNTWLTKQTHAGAFMSSMLSGHVGKEQLSLVKIHEFKLTIPEGAYIEDSQEGDFILCRDMGLKPSLAGISPSKSGSSPGSGSEDRVARTNHILDSRDDMDQILEALRVVRDFNGWDPEIEFWCANYYAATLDRTQQVDHQPNAGGER